LKRLPLLAVLGWTAFAAAQTSQFKSDWEKAQEERDWKEAEFKLPALPKADALIEFFVSSANSFKFFVDPLSLSAGADGVVRYTLVARSPSGAESVSYEGIRCASNSYKVYALGHAGAWSQARSDWKPIEPRSVQRWHNELGSRYFCPNRVSVRTAAEGLDALRLGGHPTLRDVAR